MPAQNLLSEVQVKWDKYNRKERESNQKRKEQRERGIAEEKKKKSRRKKNNSFYRNLRNQKQDTNLVKID